MHAYNYTEITIPPIIKKRGRPKGQDLTVIGLPRKKSKSNTDDKPKLQPFIKLHTSVKERGEYLKLNCYHF